MQTMAFKHTFKRPLLIDTHDSLCMIVGMTVPEDDRQKRAVSYNLANVASQTC